MRLNKVDLNLFVVFDAVYTEGNLTRAAELLSITQPAVSNALARLRQSLNDQLFVRTPEGVTPTPLAKNIVGPVREALQLLNTSIQQGDVFVPETASKTFNLSFNNAMESWVLPLALRYLQTNAPGIALTVYDVGRTNLVTELAAGKVDLAINSPLINNPDLNHALISGKPHACTVREDHPDVGEQLTLDQYLALDHIHISARRVGVGYVDAALNNLGHRRRIQLRLSDYQVGLGLVSQSDLALTIPQHIPQPPGVKALPLPFELKPQDICLYWHKSADQDQANRWLRESLLMLLKAE